MSVAGLLDEIVAAAKRKTASATTNYERQVAVLSERVRVRAEDDRHRRGVTRESVSRGGAILLPADDIDLSPHSPISGVASIPEAVDDQAVDDQAVDDQAVDDQAVDDEAGEIVTAADVAASDHRSAATGVDSSFASGWLTDR